MIVEEILDERLVRHVSDAGVMIRQEESGAIYEEAVDVRPCRFTYTETDTPIDSESIVQDKAEAYDILTGVSE